MEVWKCGEWRFGNVKNGSLEMWRTEFENVENRLATGENASVHVNLGQWVFQG